MLDPQQPPRERVSPDLLTSLYVTCVLVDIGIAWHRTVGHFQTGVLVFRLLETTIKLTTLASVLRQRRWGYILQWLLSGLALGSGIALLGQANRRAVSDPLLWVSLGAQVLAGVCVLRLARKHLSR